MFNSQFQPVPLVLCEDTHKYCQFLSNKYVYKFVPVADTESEIPILL